MSQFKNRVDAQESHIHTLRLVIGALTAIIIAVSIGWMRAPDELRVSVPPDLRTGSTRLWWDIPPENVYAFGLYIFQQLNRWANDGEKDYSRAIYALQHYVTPNCRAYLDRDYERRRTAGELRGRVRGVYEILGRGYADDPTRVRMIDRNTWRLRLDLNIDEYYLSEPVKRTAVRFPLVVVRYDVDSSKNPYGLALDCLSGEPQTLQLPNDSGEPK